MTAKKDSENSNKYKTDVTCQNYLLRNKIDQDNFKQINYLLPLNIHLLSVICVISTYFCLSVSLTFYQKWILKVAKFPLSIVVIHLTIKFLMSSVVIYLAKLHKLRCSLELKPMWKNIMPIAFASGVDIGFSNWGLSLVTVSLYTMTKSATIVFIFFFAILLRLEKLTIEMVLIISMISGGLFMFTYKSTNFNLVGFSLLIAASVSSGIRWSFTQRLMENGNSGVKNPLVLMFQMQPLMLVSVLPFSLYFEGKKIVDEIGTFLPSEIFHMLTRVSFGGLIAFFMEITEFLVISKTSSLTLSIVGVFKEVFQLILAVRYNGDILSIFNVVGLIMCLGGIIAHIFNKYLKLNQKEKEFNFEEHLVENCLSNSNQTVPLLEYSEINDSDSNVSSEINGSVDIINIIKNL